MVLRARNLKIIPRGSKVSNNEYLAQTILTISYVEIQSPHYIGTWTLRDWIVGLSAEGNLSGVSW